MVAETRCQCDGRGCLLLSNPPREQRETRAGHELEGKIDRLSALPREIIDLILSNLPLDDAVRTSVLSTRWRHMWKTIPEIVFDYNSFPVTEKEEEVQSNELKLVEAVGQVLKNHSGMIQNFVINHRNFTRAHADIDQWILHLSICPIREFVLVLRGGQDGRYKMHPSLFEWKGLMDLDLCKCSLDPFPPNFGGFKHLKTLLLHSTPMSQDRFEYLVKSCPLLEVVYYCHKESYFPILKIDAPRLFRFKFAGVFDKLIFTHTENLALLFFCMEWSISNKSKEMPSVRTSNLLDFFRCMANVRILHIEMQFLKYLIHGHVPERLPSPFSNMTSFKVETDPMCKQEIEATVCMLKSFPCLKSLTISFRGTVEDDSVSTNYFLEDKHKCLRLPEIRMVKVFRFSDRFSELNLLELILLASPNLERLRMVDFISSRGRCPVGETTRRLRLASRQAKVTMLHRESCRGTDPELVHVWLQGLLIEYMPRHMRESPPEPQEI